MPFTLPARLLAFPPPALPVALVNTSWFRVREGSVPRAVLVLDASAAAAAAWPGQRDLVARLDTLPPADRPNVAFLGSGERIPHERFTRDADRFYAANAGRGRVLGPLHDGLGGERPYRVIVCAVRPPVDLADWRDAVSLVRLDPAAPAPAGPELPFDPAAIAAALVRRPGDVRIRLAGGFPLAWDNPAYRADGAELVGTGDPTVRVAFAHPGSAAEPVAERTWEGGPTVPLPVEPTAADPALPWRTLTPAEHGALEAWSHGRPALCKACNNTHDPGVVACASGSVLPTLAAVPPGRFVRLRIGWEAASYQLVEGTAAVVEVAVVTRDGPGRFVVWQPDAAAGGWVRSTEPWGAFERAGQSDEFLLAIPPRDRA